MFECVIFVRQTTVCDNVKCHTSDPQTVPSAQSSPWKYFADGDMEDPDTPRNENGHLILNLTILINCSTTKKQVRSVGWSGFTNPPIMELGPWP